MNSLIATNRFWLLLFPWNQTLVVEQAGGEVARECRADLWRRIRLRVDGMSIPEARGYIRAQAAGIAAALVDQVLGRRSLKPTLRSRVLASGIDQLVGMTIRDALSEESTADAKTRAA